MAPDPRYACPGRDSTPGAPCFPPNKDGVCCACLNPPRPRTVDVRLAALFQVQAVLALSRDGLLPDDGSFTWEELKYNVVDPACGNDPINTLYDPDYMGLLTAARKVYGPNAFTTEET